MPVHVQRNEAGNEVEERNDRCVAGADKTESVADNVSDSARTKQTRRPTKQFGLGREEQSMDSICSFRLSNHQTKLQLSFHLSGYQVELHPPIRSVLSLGFRRIMAL